ncbi:MAG: hypothetical protein IKM97_06120 [Clostridia bacterium]|nr:hypothetical protein [Clostridia bacterium]
MKLFSLKSYKILVSLIVLIVLSVVLNNFVLAEFNVKQFDGKLDNPEIEKTKIAVSELLLDAVTAVRIVGLAIAIIILIVIGMKIMLAAPSEKATIKEYAVNYIIGAFILIAATGILTIIQRVALTAFRR